MSEGFVTEPDRKTLKIITTAQATITEEWTFDVPTGFELADDADVVLAFINGPTAAGVTFIGVDNTAIDDEQDRNYEGLEYL